MNDIKFLGVHITKNGVEVPDSVNRTLTMLENKPLRHMKDVLSFLSVVTYMSPICVSTQKIYVS